MNTPTDSVPAKFANDTITRTDHTPFHCPTDVDNPSARLRSGNPFIQGLNRSIQQLLELKRSTADNHGHRNVADETLKPNSNINLENVTELQPPTIADPVNNCLVHRQTALTWKPSVSQEGTDSTVRRNQTTYLDIQFTGCQPWRSHHCSPTQHLACDSTRGPHGPNLVGCFDDRSSHDFSFFASALSLLRFQI
jgi:hypothetical protein